MRNKIKRNKKTSLLFKEIMVMRDIVPSIKFIGSHMLFPYRWNGEQVYAKLSLSDVIKAIKWDIRL